MAILRERLEQYLTANGVVSAIEPITPDASTREYFRFHRDGKSLVACVYPDAIKHLARSYIDVSDLFLENELSVARLIDFDEVLGVVVIEDLGDRIMRAELETATQDQRDDLIREAIGIISRIQKATDSAFAGNSIASRLKFDVEKLMWELNFFKIHYFSTYKKEPLPPEIDKALEDDFAELSRELESMATVLCHRDFHAANLMIDNAGAIRIIDHQDARIGSPAYDLVSLLLDRVTETPSDEWISAMIGHFYAEREKVGLQKLESSAFSYEFHLQTIQRCLKAAGTFSFQSAARGKTYFVPFIKPMFRIVIDATEKLGRFSAIRSTLEKELHQIVSIP